MRLSFTRRSHMSKMCYHRLFIYTTCGHSSFSSVPILMCRHASIAPSSTFSMACIIVAHPYKSTKLAQLCPPCQHQRDTLLDHIESGLIVKYDTWRWKVSYGVTPHKQEAWDRQREIYEAAHGNGGRIPVRNEKTKSGRWSWMRRKSGKLEAK